MPLLFLIPLCTGLVSGYIFQKSIDEVGYLAGLISAISIVISLIIAPWEIQLVLLILVLIVTKKLLQENAYKTKIDRSHSGWKD
ncbi:MAG: hypothetical protein AAF208_11295 [Cyanobacteria bacterium P01_A01_bin.45]